MGRKAWEISDDARARARKASGRLAARGLVKEHLRGFIEETLTKVINKAINDGIKEGRRNEKEVTEASEMGIAPITTKVRPLGKATLAEVAKLEQAQSAGKGVTE